MKSFLSNHPAFHVGSVPVYGDMILAPMKGFSDLPFRSLCREIGSAMSYTEFINAMDVIGGSPLVSQRSMFLHEERPVVFQLFDNDVQRLLEAALRLQEFEPDVIDINLGCSTRRVSGRGAGAGLLRTPLKVARIFRTLHRYLEVPLSAKIRLGWDDSSRNYKLIARIIEENGGALLAVHGRTKSQGYRGHADWHAIAEIVKAVSIPVIGNGDVRTMSDVERMKKYTGCAGVMIGRAAIGNPWIFARIDREQVSQEMVRAMVEKHLEKMIRFYGEEKGMMLFRKHAVRYLNLGSLPRERRKHLLEAKRFDTLIPTAPVLDR